MLHHIAQGDVCPVTAPSRTNVALPFTVDVVGVSVATTEPVLQCKKAKLLPNPVEPACGTVTAVEVVLFVVWTRLTRSVAGDVEPLDDPTIV